jgi:hypothetical protein
VNVGSSWVAVALCNFLIGIGFGACHWRWLVASAWVVDFIVGCFWIYSECELLVGCSSVHQWILE